MAFNKKEYWKNRNNTEKVKDKDGNEVEVKRPLRGQGKVEQFAVIPPKEAVLVFEKGNVVIDNRARRRKKTENNIFRKKGYIDYLQAVRIVRRKNGVTKTKLFPIEFPQKPE